MKQKMLLLVMSVLMLLGMAKTVFADGIRYYEGEGVFSVDGIQGSQRAVNPTIEVNDTRYIVRFTGSEDGIEYVIEFEYDHSEGDETILKVVKYNGQDYIGDYYFPMTERGDYIGVHMKISDGYIYNSMEIDFYQVSAPKPQQISTGFTGTAVSDRGDYDLFIAGYFYKELTDGTHTLELSDITSQTIAIVAHNNSNDINRNMNQSTIEEMSVTVSNGQLVSAVIRGRVQTNGGTLDRYTATIQP